MSPGTHPLPPHGPRGPVLVNEQVTPSVSSGLRRKDPGDGGLGGGLGHKLRGRGGEKEEVEPARGRGRRHAGEEVNRFLAWELCPCREISELSLGQAHSPRALAWLGQRGLYLLSGAFFLLWFPHPTRHPRRGHSQSSQRITPWPSLEKQLPSRLALGA